MTARRDQAVALAALLLLLASPQAGCLQMPPRGCSASLHQQQPSTERQVCVRGGGWLRAHGGWRGWLPAAAPRERQLLLCTSA